MSGRVYVLLGKDTNTIGMVNMTEFVSGESTGFFIEGDVDQRRLGNSLDAGCDINGDGFDDVIIGITHMELTQAGIAVVLFGKASGFETLSVSTLTSEDGFVVSGGDPVERDLFGFMVGCLGFVDDDIYGDYFVAHKNDTSNDLLTTIFYGREDLSNFTMLEEEPNSHTIVKTEIAFNAGNHLGEGSTSVAFGYTDLRERAGSAFIFKDFVYQFRSRSPTMSSTESPTMSPTVSPTASPTMGPSTSPSVSPTTAPTTSEPSTSPSWSPSSSPTSAPTSSPTVTQCDVSVSTTGGAGLSWDLTDEEGEEVVSSGEFGEEAVDFTLLASEEYLLFLSSTTGAAGTTITVTVNGQDTVISLEGVTVSTEIAGVTCELITNKFAPLDSAYSVAATGLLAMLMALV